MEMCSRMGCENEAVALLSFAPQQAKAWLFDLDDPNPASGIMLCRKHANGTVVPMSWQLIDGRDPAWPGPARDGELPQELPAELRRSAPAAASGEPVADVRTNADRVEAERVDAEFAAAVAGLPSDASLHDGEFAALSGLLPVETRPYSEPAAATLRAAGVIAEADSIDDADLSLFQLPLVDVPAVTPHPDFS